MATTGRGVYYPTAATATPTEAWWATHAASVDTGLGAVGAEISRTGTYAARPAANAVPAGTIYYASDVPEQYRSNGTAWSPVGSGGNEIASAIVVANATSTVATYADVPGLSVTFVVGERPLEIGVSGALGHSSANFAAKIGIFLDGVEIRAFSLPIPATAEPIAGFHRRSGLTPGTSHTVKIALQNPSATGTATLYGTATIPFELVVKTR